MGAVYAIFGLSLVGVVLLGTFVPLHIGERVADRVGVLVTIIATLTGAGLLSLAFTLDNLVASEIRVGSFFQAPSTEGAFLLVVLMLAAGTCGLVAALVLTISDHNPLRGHARRYDGGVPEVWRWPQWLSCCCPPLSSC